VRKRREQGRRSISDVMFGDLLGLDVLFVLMLILYVKILSFLYFFFILVFMGLVIYFSTASFFYFFFF